MARCPALEAVARRCSGLLGPKATRRRLHCCKRRTRGFDSEWLNSKPRQAFCGDRRSCQCANNWLRSLRLAEADSSPLWLRPQLCGEGPLVPRQQVCPPWERLAAQLECRGDRRGADAFAASAALLVDACRGRPRPNGPVACARGQTPQGSPRSSFERSAVGALGGRRATPCSLNRQSKRRAAAARSRNPAPLREPNPRPAHSTGRRIHRPTVLSAGTTLRLPRCPRCAQQPGSMASAKAMPLCSSDSQ